MEYVKDLSIRFPVTMVHSGNINIEAPKILVLHGFLQSAQTIHTKLTSVLDAAGPHLSIQAPFPVFRQRGERYDVGYSWFFYDSKTKTYLVKRDFAIDYCEQVLKQSVWQDSIETVIGYSQGGYLAPYVAEKLPNVKQVIGIHCRFRHEDLSRSFPFRFDQIHGIEDQVVDPIASKQSHELIVQANNAGHFYELPGVGHEISSAVIDKLTEVLSL